MMTDTTEVERFEPYTDEGNREGYGQMELCEGGDWVRATDYDALAVKLAEQIEWVKRLADDLIAAEGREAKLKAKLADAERVARYETDIAQQALDQMRAAEQRVATLEAALPAVYRLAWEDAYQELSFSEPTATELMARIQTGENE